MVSGGQTGIDRAMLDFCLDNQINCGGWCPEGRKAEDGVIDLKYPLKESLYSSYSKRTAANVRDSDATVIILEDEIIGGTLKSFEFAQKEKKPFLLLDMSILDASQAACRLVTFIGKVRPMVLNFSGPRQSDWPEGYGCCYAILEEAFGRREKAPSALEHRWRSLMTGDSF